jgi:hypothetical protein
MPLDSFAPNKKLHGCFIVKNIGVPKKNVKIFGYPVPYLVERDLLDIPGVGEADIRTSLLKGEILHKILANEIIVTCSDIDLLQFNEDQKAFLQSAGIIKGLSVDSTSSAFKTPKTDIDLVGEKNRINNIFMIPDVFFLQNTDYRITLYRNGTRQRLSDDYMVAESGGPGTGYNTIIFTRAPYEEDSLVADYFL